MAKEDPIVEIKDNLEKKKIIIGTYKTLKSLKAGKLEKVFVSANCPVLIKKDIDKYCKLSNIPSILLVNTNDEIGVKCKKPFSISVLGLLKVDSSD